ncbi:hypothetical protein IWZ01DRAFT_500930 [Phyllosticta capitalensis]
MSRFALSVAVVCNIAAVPLSSSSSEKHAEKKAAIVEDHFPRNQPVLPSAESPMSEDTSGPCSFRLPSCIHT